MLHWPFGINYQERQHIVVDLEDSELHLEDWERQWWFSVMLMKSFRVLASLFLLLRDRISKQWLSVIVCSRQQWCWSMDLSQAFRAPGSFLWDFVQLTCRNDPWSHQGVKSLWLSAHCTQQKLVFIDFSSFPQVSLWQIFTGFCRVHSLSDGRATVHQALALSMNAQRRGTVNFTLTPGGSSPVGIWHKFILRL